MFCTKTSRPSILIAFLITASTAQGGSIYLSDQSVSVPDLASPLVTEPPDGGDSITCVLGDFETFENIVEDKYNHPCGFSLDVTETLEPSPAWWTDEDEFHPELDWDNVFENLFSISNAFGVDSTSDWLTTITITNLYNETGIDSLCPSPWNSATVPSYSEVQARDYVSTEFLDAPLATQAGIRAANPLGQLADVDEEVTVTTYSSWSNPLILNRPMRFDLEDTPIVDSSIRLAAAVPSVDRVNLFNSLPEDHDSPIPNPQPMSQRAAIPTATGPEIVNQILQDKPEFGPSESTRDSSPNQKR